MRNTTIKPAVILIIVMAICLTTFAEPEAKKSGKRIPSFPGAEGYGRFAMGGRGGDVYHVTNLKDDGPGSLREGVEDCKGPRTIVFDVSGTIKLRDKLTLSSSNVTIAGQTAPGDGIALRDHTFNIRDCSNVIIRYIRVRLGDESKTASDTINVSHVTDTIFDHITSTWGVDGNMDTEYLSNFTLQWSIYGEALNNATHHKGSHEMLMSLRKTSGNVSLHHNLLFSSRNRHPDMERPLSNVIFVFYFIFLFLMLNAPAASTMNQSDIRGLAIRPEPTVILSVASFAFYGRELGSS